MIKALPIREKLLDGTCTKLIMLALELIIAVTNLISLLICGIHRFHCLLLFQILIDYHIIKVWLVQQIKQIPSQ